MKLWLSKTSEVPLQHQLSAQLVLAIVSADIGPGQRLPSTANVARRFHIHANTVRLAYQDLMRRGWVEWRAGSGFFAKSSYEDAVALDTHMDLDHLVSAFFALARNSGHNMAEIQSRIQRRLALPAPDHVLVMEPDEELQAILVDEIKTAVNVRVAGIQPKRQMKYGAARRALYVSLHHHANESRATLSADAPFLSLRSRSIPKSVANESRPATDMVITVVSRWPDFLQWARTMLVAIGVDPGALDLRDARRKGWQRGLTVTSLIIADSVTAKALPDDLSPRVFRIIADESMAEIRNRVCL